MNVPQRRTTIWEFRDVMNMLQVKFDFRFILIYVLFFCHQQFKIEAIYLTVCFPDDYPLHVSIFSVLLQSVKVPAGRGSALQNII